MNKDKINEERLYRSSGKLITQKKQDQFSLILLFKMYKSILFYTILCFIPLCQLFLFIIKFNLPALYKSIGNNICTHI